MPSNPPAAASTGGGTHRRHPLALVLAPALMCAALAAPSARAELPLAKGDGYSPTARKFGMSPDALERHWKTHCPEEHRKALQPGAGTLAARIGLAGQIAEENTESIDHLRAARALLWQMLVDERAAGHTALATMVAARYSKVCGLIAKITGELATSPLVAATTINVHFTQNPESQELMSEVAEALEAYPNARKAVFEKLATLEYPDDSVIDVPVLEHQNADTATEV